MALQTLQSLCFIIVLTVISGLADAQGFVHAGQIWRADQLNWVELTKSALGFSIGISTYWLALKFMPEIGLTSPELQTITWFAVTLVGVAVTSRKFFEWTLVDQLVTLVVFVGIGWLLFRTNS